MIANTTRKGKATEAIILWMLIEKGKSVLIPWGEERYDLAVDEGGRLIRIQCKTGVLRKGCVVFKTCITDARRPQGDGGYAGQIDAFGVYCPELNKGYLVPIDELTSPFWGYLRVDPPLNGQTAGIRWANKYEIGEFNVELVEVSP